jgi:RimJ/RimL family protein N-acetyltransferase
MNLDKPPTKEAYLKPNYPEAHPVSEIPKPSYQYMCPGTERTIVMAFGPIMRFDVGVIKIELAPIPREAMAEFIAKGGMQQHTVTQYLHRGAPVLEDEHEWYDKIRTQKDSVVWGIWDITDGRKLIGNSSLHSIFGEHFRQATSGSLIFDTSYWGKGIARSAHKARTWYGFSQLGLTRIMSAVIIGNHASQRALEGSGYSQVYIERNEVFVNGGFRDKLCLECLNPDPAFWKRWWGSRRPTKLSLDARKRTIASLDWAREHVTLL